jgi:sister-chromatid-cohesion protein PDS5
MSFAVFLSSYSEYLTLQKADDHAKKVSSYLDALIAVLKGDGQLSSVQLSTQEVVQLRATVTLQLLKAVQNKDIERLFSVRHYQTLAVCMQDAVYEVREIFVNKLIKKLSHFAMHARYLTILFLVAFEPEDELLNKVKGFIIKLAARLRQRTSSLF